MKHFKPFPGENTDPLALQFNRLIATALERPSSTTSFFNQFNQDVKNINFILDHPSSLDAFHQMAFERQEEHNEVLQKGHIRWVNSSSNYAVGVNAVHQLKEKAEQYKKAFALKRQFELRQKQVQTLLSDAGWIDILALAHQAGCLETIKALKLDWIEQARFAHYNSEDLAMILKELKNLYLFLKLIQSISHPNQIIVELANRNIELLERLDKQIAVAISWRIYAASLRGNLWFDDTLWALDYQLSGLLEKYIPDYEDNPDLFSRSLNPSILKIFIRHLQKTILSKKEEAFALRCKEKWLGSRWITNPYQQYPIEVAVTSDLELIPSVLEPLIPNTSQFPDEFMRYFHFRGKSPDKKIEKLLKKRLLGSPYELIIFLNEAVYQVDALEWVASQKPMVLTKMTQTPGFKSALWFPVKVDQEKARMHCLVPNSVVLQGLTWFFRSLVLYNTQNFLSNWEVLLDQIENHIYAKGKSITAQMILNLESDLVKTIQEMPSAFPKHWIADVNCFVGHYGSTLEKQRVREILSPVYLFNQFQFVVASNSEVGRQLDQKAVDLFLMYAKSYWTPSEFEAAQIVASILEGHFSQTKKDDYTMVTKLLPWFSQKRFPNDAVLEFLNTLGLEIVVKIGSRSNALAHRFLKQYSPSALKIWEKEREKDLNKKYLLLISALEKPVGSELNLYTREKGIEIEFMDDLKNGSPHSHYIKALGDALEDYLKQYEGQNGAYATWVYYHFEIHRAKYFMLRIQYLLKIPETAELSVQELSLYKPQNGALKSLLKEALCSADRVTFKVFNKNIYSMVCASRDAELQGIYHFKRVKSLVEEGDFDTLHEETYLFDKNNPFFQKHFNEFFKNYLKKYIFDIARVDDNKLEWIVEFYGDEAVKEENRYLSIKRYLDHKPHDASLIFLKKIKRYLVHEQISDLFSLDEYKNRLAMLFHAYNQTGWDANAQYLMESLPYPQIKTCVFEARLAWLNQLLFQVYPAFSLDPFILFMHTKNWEAPNSQLSLKTFFGPLVPKAKELLVQYLAQPCRIESHDRKLALMGRYLEDEAFKGDDQWKTWTFKIEVLKNAYAIVGCLKKQNWVEATERLSQLQTELNSNRYLLPYTNPQEMKLKKGFYEQVFNALKESLVELKWDINDRNVQSILALLQMPKISPVLKLRAKLF